MNNFHCINCDHEFFVEQYTLSIQKMRSVYKARTGKVIACPNCQSPNISYIEKEGDFKSLELGKYSMKSVAERQQSLKARSRKHFKEKIKERQHAINNSATLGTLGD